MGSVLLIDAGNTRLKWQLRPLWQVEEKSSVLAHGVQSYSVGGWERDWTLPDGPAAIWVGSVASAAVNQRIVDWCGAQSFSAPTFVATAREALGLRVAYQDVTRLGVDRYLAMIGARQRARGATCVVDIGTALTLDAIDARGMHIGGLIAPGPGTMVQSLLRGTSGIRDASRSIPADMFAKDTAEAVTGGACFAVAALIDRFVATATARFGGDATTFVTGGGQGTVESLVSVEMTSAPDLVFDGLMALCMARRPSL